MKKQIITACAFIHKDGKVLIGKRSMTKPFLPGKWELLGGKVEYGETVEHCLKRELLEELHIDIDVDKIYSEFTYVIDEEEEHVIEVLYLATMKDPTQAIRLNDYDHEEYKWISEQEIDEYYADNDDEGNAIRKGFKALL